LRLKENRFVFRFVSFSFSGMALMSSFGSVQF
jgi:hypothetical protein